MPCNDETDDCPDDTARVAGGTTVFMSIDEHQAVCAQQRAAGTGVGDSDDDGGYEVSDESEDPLGGFDSSDEEHVEGTAGRSSSCRHSMHHQRASSGRQSMRMSMAFTPSKPGGSLLTSDDQDTEATPHNSQARHDGAEEVYISSDDEVRAPALKLSTAATATVIASAHGSARVTGRGACRGG